MSAAAVACVPLAQEGQVFWEDLVAQCRRYATAINDVVSDHGLPADQLVECNHGRELQMAKSVYPSTHIRLAIEFFSWGPVISGRVIGQETANLQFSPEEWEIPIAKDLDGTVVAIFDQGRSFSAHELARYVAQSLRRCYPAVSLPCECNSATC